VETLSMNLRLIKSTWGAVQPIDGESIDEYWQKLLSRYKAEGYYGVEAIGLTYLDAGSGQPNMTFLNKVKEAGLVLVPQVHTCGGHLTSSGYVYCSSRSVDEHVASLEAQLGQLKAVAEVVPVPIVNVHSGHDSWGGEAEALAFFERALDVGSSSGFKVVHETHRQRTLFNPYVFSRLAGAESLGALRVNADLSHWVAVCEHLFDPEGEPERDSFWPEVLEKLGETCDMIHARVGYDEGPQIPVPESPAFKAAIEKHLGWWEKIWEAQRKRGLEEVFVTTEFGPYPYAALGTSDERLDEINTWMKDRVLERWNGTVSAPAALSPPPSAGPSPLRVIDATAIRAKVTHEIAYDAAVLAFKALSNDQAQSPTPVQLAFPAREGETCIKPGYVEGAGYYAVKVASGFQKNKDEGRPSGSGVIMVFDAKYGSPSAVLADNGYLTDVRTAAAVVLGAKSLTLTAGGKVDVGVIGCGVMAQLIIEMLSGIMGKTLGGFRCHSRTRQNVLAMVDRVESSCGVKVKACESAKECVEGCGLVVTTTCAKSPVLSLSDFGEGGGKGVTIVAMGSDTPGKREISQDTLQRIFEGGGKVFADTVDNATKLGECQYWKQERSRIGLLGDIVTGKVPGREADEMILVDLTGTGVQDAAIASVVMGAF